MKRKLIGAPVPGMKKEPKRAGSYKLFMKRFKPVTLAGQLQVFEHKEVLNVPTARVWTVVDCDGKSYLQPGWHLVNRLGYVVAGCERGPGIHSDYLWG